MEENLNDERNIQINKLIKEKKKRSGSCIYSFFCWTFQILTWISLILVYLENKGIYYLSFIKIPPIFFLVSYIIYLILEFCSSTCRYLFNKHENLYSKLRKIFSSLPEIIFKCECYHYETRTYIVRDSNGSHEETETVKVVTHTETYSLPYYSFQDVSGLFILSQELEKIKNAIFIKLELDKEINFADNISYYDYLREKHDFYDRNVNRDEFMDMWEKRKIKGYKKYNLVRIGDKKKCTVGGFIYIIFVLITLAQFYKYYVNYFSIYKYYKIRKIISTRYDLQDIKFRDTLFPLIPKVNIIIQKYDFKLFDTSFCFRQYNPVIPTQNEINKAKNYENEVPLYKVNLQTGIIEDIPYFNKKKYDRDTTYKNIDASSKRYLIHNNDNYYNPITDNDKGEIQLIQNENI